MTDGYQILNLENSTENNQLIMQPTLMREREREREKSKHVTRS